MTKVRNAIFACLFGVGLAAAQVDPGLLNLAPSDAKVFSGIRVDAAKSSSFGKYVLSQMQSDDAAFLKFVQDTGFDPKRDLNEIFVATGGTADKPTMLVLGRGFFNAAKILTTAQAAGATVTPYKNGIQLLSHGQDGSTMGVLAFLPDGSTALMGTMSAVTDAIDRYSSKTSGSLPQGVTQKIADLSSKNDAWFLSTVSPTDFFAGKIADPNLSGAMAGNLLQAIQQANGGMKFNTDGVLINGEALARSQKDAEALRDVVKFLAGLVQLNKDSDPNAQKIASLLDTMQVSAQDSKMQLSLSIPENTMEQLFMPGLHKSPGPARARTPRKTASLR